MLNYPYFKINQGFVEITIKLDAKVDIEGTAEIKQENKEINKAILEYETSEGLKTIEFKSVNNIENCIDGNFVYIEERKEDKLIKELATISLESFVSFTVERSKKFNRN